MKKNKILLFLSLFMLVLSACNPLPDNATEDGGQEEMVDSGQNNANVVSNNQLGADYYRPALDENGQYQTSENRGITLNLNSNINISLFEKDLMRLSQETFPTDTHFIQEGQYLPGGLVNTWLGRESEDNPEGLNPPASGEGEDRVPNYLNSILEFDFFTQGEEGLNLAGISIGLAMNSVDYYPEYQFGPILEQDIPQNEMIEQGQNIADEIVSRVREMEGLAEIPIYIGLYEQAAQDDLAGGVYVAQGQSTNGSTAIESWETVNEERQVFPLEGDDSAEGNAFANFQSEVESFFPNLGGITGRAHYINDELDNLTIDIMTQFYGETEMVSFTQYLKQSATTFLPADLDVEIIVQSPDGMEAFLQKDSNGTDYFSYVFN